MKTTTATKLIQKEAEFLGLGIYALLRLIKRDGRMVYSAKSCEAEYTLRLDNFYPNELNS